MQIVDLDGGIHIANREMGGFLIKGEINDAHRTRSVGKARLFIEVGQVGFPTYIPQYHT
jgi:hypothetical protein